MPNMTRRPNPQTMDAYVAGFSPEIRQILQNIRRTVLRIAPKAEETISYRMPAFKLHGVLLYFAAFKNHIGLYPPVRGDARLIQAVKPYAGPKGNLRFPLDQPMPYTLIAKIVRLRMKQNLAKRGK